MLTSSQPGERHAITWKLLPLDPWPRINGSSRCTACRLILKMLFTSGVLLFNYPVPALIYVICKYNEVVYISKCFCCRVFLPAGVSSNVILNVTCSRARGCKVSHPISQVSTLSNDAKPETVTIIKWSFRFLKPLNKTSEENTWLYM